MVWRVAWASEFYEVLGNSTDSHWAREMGDQEPSGRILGMPSRATSQEGAKAGSHTKHLLGGQVAAPTQALQTSPVPAGPILPAGSSLSAYAESLWGWRYSCS